MCRPSRSTGLPGGQRYQSLQSLSHLIKEIDLLAEQKLAEIGFAPDQARRGAAPQRARDVCVSGRVKNLCMRAHRLRATEGCMDFSCLAA